MDVSKELEMAIANEHEQIKSVIVTYDTGKLVSGFVKTVEFRPLTVTLNRHKIIRGENPLHNIDFDSATQIELLYQNDTTKSFK